MSEALAPRRFERVSQWVSARWAVVTLVSVALLVPGAAALIHNNETSPLDEWVFIDYTSKVFSEGFVRRGETVNVDTAELMACYGVIPGGKFGTCGTGEEIFAELPYGGRNGAADYTPAYFWVTAVVGGAIHLLTGIDQLTSWRMTGAFWLAAAMVMIYLLFRRWKIHDGTTLALGLLLIGTPYVLWAHSFVSTDAPSLFIGATLLFLAIKIRSAEISPWWLVLASAIGLAFKVTNMAAIGLVCIYLIGSWIIQLIRSRRGAALQPKLSVSAGIIAPVLALAASSIVQLGWLRFLTATAIPAPSADQGISMPLTFGELGLQLVNYLPASLTNNPLSALEFNFIWTPISWIMIAGVIGAPLVLKRWGGKAEVTVATGIAAVVMAPALAIIFWVVNHSYFQLPPRYGVSLAPAFLFSSALLVRNSVARWVIGGYGVLLIAASIVLSIGLNLANPVSG